MIGSALRIFVLTDWRFHSDEALFATLGRLIITGRDPLLAETTLLVDKPPLFYYLLALMIAICWGCELTARLTGLFSSMVVIALTARLARRIAHSNTAPFLAALLIATSPMAVLFSVTVFADPLMLMWLLASLVLLLERRAGWSGLCFGLALASKQNAIFFLPLLVFVFFAHLVDKPTKPVGRVLRFMAGVGLVVALMLLWEAARSPELGFWGTGFARNNPGRLIRRSELVPRLTAWWGIIRTCTPGWILSVVTIVIGLSWPVYTVIRQPRQSSTIFTMAIGVFVVAYFALHWLVAFPLFDRYFLLPLPLLSALAAAGLASILSALPSPKTLVVLIGGVFIMTSLTVSLDELPIGGNHGSNDGIDLVAEFIRHQPAGTIVYHQSLGWLLSYYSFDDYVVPVTVDSPDALTADLIAFAADPSPRFVVLSPADGPQEMKRAAEKAGFSYETVLTTISRQGRPTFEVLELAN